MAPDHIYGLFGDILHHRHGVLGASVLHAGALLGVCIGWLSLPEISVVKAWGSAGLSDRLALAGVQAGGPLSLIAYGLTGATSWERYHGAVCLLFGLLGTSLVLLISSARRLPTIEHVIAVIVWYFWGLVIAGLVAS